MKPKPLIYAALAALLPFISHAAWQRLPAAANRPVDLAIGSLEGVKIHSSNNIGQVSSLLSDSVNATATLPTGESDAVIDLGRVFLVERVAFYNLGGEGKFSVAGSADNSSWVPLGQSVFGTADDAVALRFAGVQARYVKVAFDLSRGAMVKNFTLHGTQATSSVQAIKGKISNMSSGLSGARVIYAHPNPTGGAAEGSRYGSFAFPESAEKYRTVIYDLGRPRVLNEFGSVHSPRPVRLEVFAFTELPEKEDWKGRRTFDVAVLDDTEPVASVEDAKGVGYAKVKPSKSVTARYVALRWEPDFNPPAFVVGGIDLISSPQDVEAGGAGGAGAGEGAGAGAGAGNEDGTSDGAGQSGEAVANSFANGASGSGFAPNSLMGAGSGGLPATAGFGGGAGGGGGGGAGAAPVVGPASPGN